MTESKVVGRRLGFWQGTTPFWRGFILFCPLCFVAGAAYLFHLRHLPFGVIADDYFLQVGASVIGIIMGPVGLITLQSRRRAYVIASACPVCGVDAARDFGDANATRPSPVPCGKCVAYLHVQPKNLRVREVRFDETSLYMDYGLLEQQYVGIVPRTDAEDRPFAFVMPTFCAICSAPDARFQKEIGYCGDTSDSKGALRGILYPMNYVGKGTPNRTDDLDNANRHIKTPACEAHKDKIAMERDSGYLRFASYRFYREFCSLNKITDGAHVALEKAEAGIPAAVARSA